MTAQSIGIYTIEFPDPYVIDYYNDKFVTLGVDNSFQYPLTDNIQTLTTKNVERGNDPYGILYVPELRSDGCKKSEEDYVPANATRLRNLPQNANYALIAIAPWFSPNCTIEYFDNARKSPVKAFLVYQPGTGGGMPPPMSDASWSLDDGGSWKGANNFPTYAIMPTSGDVIMRQLSLYSGNITDVPYGRDLVSSFSPTSYVRLWANVNTASGSQLPSLWVFLVIVLGLLTLVIIVTSTFMHIVQRRRRNDLRQRVIDGEVDLEALGVKRLTVPREFMEKLPLYTYSSLSQKDLEKTLPPVPVQAHSPLPKEETQIETMPTPLSRRSSALQVTTTAPNGIPAFSQPTCPICLDDFEPNETQVRELPCRHIFHPDCIDTFLLSNSSLCPVCKTSVLPTGYCPAKITNIMVRRERMIRRMRARSAAANEQNEGTPSSSAPQHTFGSLGSRIGGAIASRRVFSAPVQTQPRPPDIEMATASTTVNATDIPRDIPAEPQTQPNNTQDCTEETAQNRREWARQRALALLGNRHAPLEAEEEVNAGPRWRRGLRKVFPGFR